MRRLSLILFFAICWMAPGDAAGRLMKAWSYAELMKEADLVVIARPTATRALRETAPLPNIFEQDQSEKRKPVIARAVETEFSVVVKLKGKLPGKERRSKRFTLLHYQEIPRGKMTINGPGLVSFDPGDNRQFLLFLTREKDGRYSAVSGQTDPDQSIEPLRLRSH